MNRGNLLVVQHSSTTPFKNGKYKAQPTLVRQSASLYPEHQLIRIIVDNDERHPPRPP